MRLGGLTMLRFPPSIVELGLYAGLQTRVSALKHTAAWVPTSPVQCIMARVIPDNCIEWLVTFSATSSLSGGLGWSWFHRILPLGNSPWLIPQCVCLPHYMHGMAVVLYKATVMALVGGIGASTCQRLIWPLQSVSKDNIRSLRI